MTYRIVEGGRRSKPAELLGWTEIECVVLDKDDHEVEKKAIPLADLRSRKLAIEVDTADKQARFNGIFRAMQTGQVLPPPYVRRGRLGIPISQVTFDLTGEA